MCANECGRQEAYLAEPNIHSIFVYIHFPCVLMLSSLVVIFDSVKWPGSSNEINIFFILCESNNFHIQNQKAIFTMKVFKFSFFLYLFVCICEEFFISLKCALYTRATAADNHLTVCTARSYIESMLLIEPLSVLHSRQATCTPRAAFIYGVATHTHVTRYSLVCFSAITIT